MIDKTALVRWEAAYENGRTIREDEGVLYTEIPRVGLVEFRLLYEGGIIFATRPPEGADGWALRYRIGGEGGDGPTIHMFRIGWVPFGPAFLIDVNAMDTGVQGFWVDGRGFHECHEGDAACDHPLGWFSPPVPVGGER